MSALSSGDAEAAEAEAAEAVPEAEAASGMTCATTRCSAPVSIDSSTVRLPHSRKSLLMHGAVSGWVRAKYATPFMSAHRR